MQLATLLSLRQVVSILLRFGPKHLSFLLPTQLQTWDSFRVAVCLPPAGRKAFGRSSMRSRGRAGPVSRWVCLSAILARCLLKLLLPLAFSPRICPMSCSSPSLFVLLDSAFFRNLRCISFHQRSLRELH